MDDDDDDDEDFWEFTDITLIRHVNHAVTTSTQTMLSLNCQLASVKNTNKLLSPAQGQWGKVYERKVSF